jgi:hypothetical protein
LTSRRAQQDKGKTMKRIIQRAALFLATFLGLPGGALGYEQPRYDVHKSLEGYEIRRYDSYWIVETEVAGDFETARNAAFRKLFDYISGNNQQQRKIEMTVPVVSRAAGQKIEMTVPVVTHPAGGSDRHVMQFFLPSRFAGESAPRPIDPDVRLRQIDARWVAARTYSGRSSESGYRQNEAELLRLLRSGGVVVTGAPAFAVYNGPFTPWFMRRNEVIVPIAAPPALAP